MPETKKYLSKIVKGSETLHLKDAEARQDILDIKSSITGAMHYVGITTTELTDGATVATISVEGKSVEAKAGDVAIYGELEFVFSGTKWQEYGSTGSLKALAFKDNASGSFTPAGNNSTSAVSFEGQTDGDFVTGFNDDAVAPSLGDPTKSNFATEGETSAYDETTETLTFSDASTAQAVTAQGDFSAGSAATLATAKAITAVGTGTAAAQTFTGTQDTITVN